MRRKYQLLILVLIFLAGVAVVYFMQQAKQPEPVEPPEEVIVQLPDTVKLLFVGDIMVHSTQFNSARYEGGDTTYNFYPVFQYIEDYIQSADLAAGNLEVPFGGEPYSGYPVFSSPKEIADDLKKAGFDLCLLANNHMVDKGKKGLENTIDHLDQIGMLHTGAFKDTASRNETYPLIVEVNNLSIAFLNYSYGTNGMPVTAPNIVNLIDTLQIAKDLATAKELRADYIITCIHWGAEYQNKEGAHQRKIAQYLADHGTDMIVGGHPHVLQPYDEIVSQAGDTVPVAYSLGNFISNQRWRYADGAAIFEVILEKHEGKTRLISTGYEPFWVNRYNDAKGRIVYRVIPVNDYIKNPEKYELSKNQKDLITQFNEDTRQTLSNLKFSGYY